jgi:hypothetical protein
MLMTPLNREIASAGGSLRRLLNQALEPLHLKLREMRTGKEVR